MGDSVKSLSGVKVDIFHCSPLSHPAGCATIEGCQIGQVQRPLRESILTTPDNKVLRIFKNFIHIFFTP